MKYFLFGLISLIAWQAIASDKINVEILDYKVIGTRIGDYGFVDYTPAIDNDEFIRLIVRVQNTSNQKITYDLNNILLEGNGIGRVPLIFLVNSIANLMKENTIKLEPEQSKERKIIYCFPKAFKPTNLLVDNNFRVPLSDEFKESKILLDKDWNIIGTADSAKYYRTITKTGDQAWLLKQYYIENDQLEMESEISSIYPVIKEGKTKRYYQNGHTKEEGYYQANKKTDTFNMYYESGIEAGRIEYSETETKYLQRWNMDGDSLLIAGNGIIRATNEKGNQTVDVYEDYLLKEQMEIRNEQKDTLYSCLEKFPEYVKGISAYLRLIEMNQNYPKESIGKGIEGQVLVQFIVDQSGNVTEVETLKGLDSACNQEAERLVRLSKKWKPGTHDGKAVKTKMVQPINFELDYMTESHGGGFNEMNRTIMH